MCLLKINYDSNYFIDFESKNIIYSGKVLVIDGENVFRIYNPDITILERRGDSVYVLDKEGTEIDIVIPKGDFNIVEKYGEIKYNEKGVIWDRLTTRNKEVFNSFREKLDNISEVLEVDNKTYTDERDLNI